MLILDTDSDTLIALQSVFENANIDTSITWDASEARQLIESAPYDLLLIGNHPPELDPALIIEGFSFRGTCPSVLILQTVESESELEYFRRLGAIGTAPKT